MSAVAAGGLGLAAVAGSVPQSLVSVPQSLIAEADRVACGEVTEIGIPWSFPSNRVDWLFDPTKAKGPFNPEWTWQLNRMQF